MTKKTKTIQHGKFTIVIHRPELTKEEAARRGQQVLSVLESTPKFYIRKENKA